MPKRLRIRYGLTSHMNLYGSEVQGGRREQGVLLGRGNLVGVRQDDNAPRAEKAGLFRVQAKPYGNDSLTRVIALARPTA